MQDRGLLVLAAKAAGRDVIWKHGMHQGEPREGLYDRATGHATSWNPLTDDGDALRLAVKLELQLRLRHSENEVSVYGAPDGRIDEGVRGDPAAATRRAIVRAAAEIGRDD